MQQPVELALERLPSESSEANVALRTPTSVSSQSTDSSIHPQFDRLKSDVSESGFNRQENALVSIKIGDGTEDAKTGADASTSEGSISSFFELFRFATLLDKALIVIGLLGSATVGMGLPLFSIVFGNVLSEFGKSEDEMLEKIRTQVLYFIYIGIGSQLSGIVGLGSLMYVSDRLTKAMREKFLQSVLKQHIGWFDSHKPGEISSKLSNDSASFQSGTGEKIATLVQHSVVFLGGLAVGLVRGWQLALLILATTPFMGILVGLLSSVMGAFNKRSQDAYSQAANIADESLQGIRTVTAFSSQEKEIARYKSKLVLAKQAGIKAGFTQGATMGGINIVFYSSFALSLWFGGWLIREAVYNPWTGEDWTGGDVFTVFFALLMASQSIGLLGPCLQAITVARGAAYRLFEVIDAKSQIDPSDDRGTELNRLSGDIQINNIKFAYATRRDAPVFTDFSLSIPAGKTTALVGHSGCGKSTLIGLLERFYDVEEGSITVDGADIRSLKLKWWREQIGLVAQEPILFDGTVRENIAYGRDGISEEQIVAAAKAANAHKFITELPNGYDSKIGDNGSLLSGGQKQRIAIARAIVKNPPIMLLDEATSALDNESERLVKEALERLMSQRTSIVIAHRLTTVRNADLICVLSEGQLLERGTHEQLMAKNGAYANLVKAQEMAEADGTIAEENEDEEDSDSAEQLEVKEAPFPTNGSPNQARLEILVDSTLGVRSEPEAQAPPSKRAESRKRPNNKATPESTQRKRPESAGANSEKKTKKKKKEKELKDGELPNELVPQVSVMRVWRVALRLGWPWITLAIFAASAGGASLPLWGFMFGDMTRALFEPDMEKQETDTRFWALMFLVLGFGISLCELGKYSGFGMAGERVTEHLRTETFRSFLRQEIGFFDEELHNPRILAARLSKDASLVHQGTTQKATLVVQVFATLMCGMIISFYYDWRLTLVTLCTFPALAISWAIQTQMFVGASAEGKKSFEQAEKIANEAIANIRTVASLAVEPFIQSRFSEKLAAPMKHSARSALSAGFARGFSEFAMFASYALAFWYGAKRVDEGPLVFGDMMKVVFSIVITAIGVGEVTQFAPDFTKAAIARNHIFYYLDRKSKIDSESTEGPSPVLQHGAVSFRDVQFTYPTRPDRPVLKGLSLDVKPGSTVALVGPSGCGKSTIVSLLLRLYEPTAGRIFIDGQDICEMNVKSLRSQLAVVSQEPRLFDATIAENIEFGKPGATIEEIVEAAKQANIHDAIMAFPDQYNTKVGLKGGQLSGGQKQRVAIARALIRKPRVLLLDEATSALDTKSERVVQDALERLMRRRDRTIIVIAHRLSTIQNCDAILVFDKGSIVESGTHQQLIAMNGVYAALARAAESGAGVSS